MIRKKSIEGVYVTSRQAERAGKVEGDTVAVVMNRNGKYLSYLPNGEHSWVKREWSSRLDDAVLLDSTDVALTHPRITKSDRVKVVTLVKYYSIDTEENEDTGEVIGMSWDTRIAPEGAYDDSWIWFRTRRAAILMERNNIAGRRNKAQKKVDQANSEMSLLGVFSSLTEKSEKGSK